MNLSNPVPFKPCACGIDHTLSSWLSLPLVGRQSFPGEPVLELRNCSCGSTIGVELPAKPVRRPTLRGVGPAAPFSAPTPTRPTPVPQSGSRYSFVSPRPRSFPPGSSLAAHIQTRNV